MARLSKEENAKRKALLEKKAKLKPDIATWVPNENQLLIEDDNKIFIVKFDIIFGNEKLKQYNRFIVDKTSYVNNLDIITKYVNYFMNKYDDENDLAVAYLKLKVEMDKYRSFNEENVKELIDFLYEVMFHERMVGKIIKLFE